MSMMSMRRQPPVVCRSSGCGASQPCGRSRTHRTVSSVVDARLYAQRLRTRSTPGNGCCDRPYHPDRRCARASLVFLLIVIVELDGDAHHTVALNLSVHGVRTVAPRRLHHDTQAFGSLDGVLLEVTPSLVHVVVTEPLVHVARVRDDDSTTVHTHPPEQFAAHGGSLSEDHVTSPFCTFASTPRRRRMYVAALRAPRNVA